MTQKLESALGIDLKNGVSIDPAIVIKNKGYLASVIRSRAKKLVDFSNRVFVEIGGLLYIIDRDQVYKHWNAPGGKRFTSFARYCAEDLKLSVSTAYAYLGIYKTFCIDLEVPPEKLSKLSYSNVREIKSIVTKENVNTWIEKIRDVPYTQVYQEVNKAKHKILTDIGSRHNFNFSLNEDQYKNYVLGIEVVQKMAGAKGEELNPGYCLDLIISSFLATAEETPEADLTFVLRQLEKVRGIKLIACKEDDIVYGHEFLKTLADVKKTNVKLQS